ncbi:MAG: hypothetical protein R3359_10010 [Marinirhabdus sp.]|nr:hypothetical protein [Marinirhabdus sp.]
MKKLVLIAVFAVFGITASNAQGFNVGASAAIPSGDFDDFYGFGVVLDASYLFPINDVFHVGPASGVMHYFGKDSEQTIAGVTVSVEADDATFIPVAGEARFYLEQFFFGAHLGYGLGVSDGFDGGFYYRPGVGYMFTETVGAAVSYSGISGDGATFNSINAGITFSFQ